MQNAPLIKQYEPVAQAHECCIGPQVCVPPLPPVPGAGHGAVGARHAALPARQYEPVAHAQAC